jgi:phosphonoacetaldehyde hydrolase
MEWHMGRVPAVFLDWAGTVVDHGSVAPVKALEDIFAAARVPVDRAVVRRFMGLAKKDHIRKILEEPEVAARWAEAYGERPVEDDVVRLYAAFEPQMMERLAGYAEVIPGAVETVAALRSRGIKVAGTTGYTRPMLERLEALAAEQGYRTDRSLVPEDAGGGRPYPWMIYKLALELEVYPLSRCVKIGDTVSDIEEGLNAGMWTIGLTRSGNSVGLTLADWENLEAGEKERMLALADAELKSAGAHYTVESIGEVLAVIEEIENRE